jgi:hypothetical protein
MSYSHEAPQKVMNRSSPAEKEDPSWVVVNQRNCFKVHLSTAGRESAHYMSEADEASKTCLAIEKGQLCRIFAKEPTNEDRVGDRLSISGILGIVNISGHLFLAVIVQRSNVG